MKSKGWDTEKVYLIEAEREEQDCIVQEELLLWRKGICELRSKRQLSANIFTKTHVDKWMYVLGNCEIVIDKGKVFTKKKSRNYFVGLLGYK